MREKIGIAGDSHAPTSTGAFTCDTALGSLRITPDSFVTISGGNRCETDTFFKVGNH